NRCDAAIRGERLAQVLLGAIELIARGEDFAEVIVGAWVIGLDRKRAFEQALRLLGARDLAKNARERGERVGGPRVALERLAQARFGAGEFPHLALAERQVFPEHRLARIVAHGAFEIRQRLCKAVLAGERHAEELAQDWIARK